MNNFITIFVVLMLVSLVTQNPPTFVLQALANRLYRKTLKKYQAVLEADKKKLKEGKDTYKELIKDQEETIERLKNTRDNVSSIVSRYQDSGKSFRKVIKTFYEYLQLEYEIADQQRIVSESGIAIMELMEFRKMVYLSETYEKIFKEWKKYGVEK